MTHCNVGINVSQIMDLKLGRHKREKFWITCKFDQKILYPYRPIGVNLELFPPLQITLSALK